MAFTHVMFHLPAGVIGIAFYQVLATPDTHTKYAGRLWTVYLLSMSVSIFGSLVDFFIYMYAFPAFREGAQLLVSTICLCKIFHIRNKTTNGHNGVATRAGRLSNATGQNLATIRNLRVNNAAHELESSFESRTIM